MPSPVEYASRRWILLREQPRRQQRHRPPGGALLLALFPRRARDIEMGPVVFLREPRQKTGSGDAAAGTAGDIREIGEIARETVLIILPQRHLPRTVIRVVTGGQERARQCFIVAEQPACDMAK